MAEERVRRRLAAILAADVVGYSRLMGDDEAGTLAAVTSHISGVFEPEIAAHNGRIFKLMGDAVFAEFASVVDAVECAVSVQDTMRRRNNNQPGQRRIDFRIGVNLGDIIVQGDDIFGDGVNVASRLESLAEPGGICVSEDAHRQVSGRLNVEFVDIGDQNLKNIARLVRAYKIVLAVPGGDGLALGATAFAGSEKPSIAVLPFENLSGDPEQEYFSDGISEDIITALSHVRWFFVTARNSSFSYKGQSPDVRKVSKDLGVQYVLEGSVRKSGNRVRITAQLIEGESGNHIWAERYDRELEDIFAVQDEITTTVVGAIQPELSRAEQTRAHRKSSENMDAWELYQKGVWHIWRDTREDTAEADRLLRNAIELDPEFCLAHAFLAFTTWRSVVFHYTKEPKDALDNAFASAKRAVALDSSDAHAHWALGVVYMQRREHELATEELEKAITLNPSFASAYQWLGWTMAYDGQPEEAIRKVEEAQRLSPNDPVAWGMMLIQAQAYLNMKEFAKSESLARKAKRISNTVPINCTILASSGHTGNKEDADALLQEVLAVESEFTAQRIAEVFPFGRQGDLDLWIEGLQKAGVPD